MSNKPLVTADELEALLVKNDAVFTDTDIDKYFPLRVFLFSLGTTFWFLRLTLFTDVVAKDLFSDESTQQQMMTALYFRAWIVFISFTLILLAYKSEKFLAICFGIFFIASVFNILFDVSIFYAEKLAQRDAQVTFTLLIRIFFSYLFFVSMRNANRVPTGRDKWNPFLFLKKANPQARLPR
jgi:hypothetical protein